MLTIATGKDMHYEDELRRATYTTNAHMNGPQGDLRGVEDRVVSRGGRRTLERAEAYDDVIIKTDERTSTGNRMTYFAADERYLMKGTPVKVVENCRETAGKTLTFWRATDRILVDGNEEIRTQTTRAAARARTSLTARSEWRRSRTHELTKSYGGRTVVRGVSLEVNSGEVVGLLGPNGAGKTTTFYMTVGLTAPDSGRVMLDGQDVTDDPMYVRARKGIGYLPQEPSIFRGLTVEQNILAILETLRSRRAERRAALRGAARRARPDAAGASRRPTRCRAASGGAPRSRARW